VEKRFEEEMRSIQKESVQESKAENRFIEKERF
jgi:hypothetical protein